MKIPPEEEMRSGSGGADTGAGREGREADPRGVDCGRTPNEVHRYDDKGITSSTRAVIVEYANTVIVALVLAAFIMTFIARSFLVQGSSMEPTLHHGERLLVNRFVYRFSEPKRGDIVVFRYPENPRQMFIKRVIGVPGDVVQITGGVVYVSGTGLVEPYIAEPPMGEYGPALVPAKRVFVLGDNRNCSHDSTDESVGMVPYSSIQGKAFLVYWPFSQIRACKNPSYSGVPDASGSDKAIVPGMV